MKTSRIKLEEFNDCPGADAVKHYLYMHNLLPYLSVVDLDDVAHCYDSNRGDTLVLAISRGQTEMSVALALGRLAVWFAADEFTWYVSEGTYIVRLWWD
jgi:hypothetical protein